MLFRSGAASRPVKQKIANEIGLYDMSGNAEEWCYDFYAKYTSDDQVDPSGPETGSSHVMRGGCWNHYGDVTCTTRSSSSSSSSVSCYGLRLASY